MVIETRMIDGQPRRVQVLEPVAARGSFTAEDWARKRKPKSSTKWSSLIRDHILRNGRPTY